MDTLTGYSGFIYLFIKRQTALSEGGVLIGDGTGVNKK